MILKKRHFLYYFLAIQVVTGLSLSFFVDGSIFEGQLLVIPATAAYIGLVIFTQLFTTGGDRNIPMGLLGSIFFLAWAYLVASSFINTYKKKEVSLKIGIVLLIFALVFIAGCTVVAISFDSAL